MITQNETAGPREGKPAAPNERKTEYSLPRSFQAGRLPEFLRDLLASPPRHGAGVHQWLFRVARQLHAHRDAETICALLAAAVDGCGRHVPASEIRAAVESAAGCAWQPTGGARLDTPRPKWPARNDLLVARILSQPFTEYDIWESSPVRIEGEAPDAEWFIDGLFPGNPLLCLGRSNSDFETAPREHFRSTLHDMSLIVPSPMTAIWGTRKSDGQESMHTLANTGPRAYLVTEFDSGTPDEQCSFIWHLREFAPLVMILSSAGKSRHAWWNCRGTTEAMQRRFFRYAVSVGADPATWTRSQFVRLPMGWRHDKTARQRVLYFNPEHAGTEVAP